MVVWEEPTVLGVVVAPPEQELEVRLEALDQMVAEVAEVPKVWPLLLAQAARVVRILSGLVGFLEVVFLSVLLGPEGAAAAAEHLPEQVMVVLAAPEVVMVAGVEAAVLPRVQGLLAQAVRALMAF